MEIMFKPAALHGTVPAPASKSEAHRCMICAGLTTGKTQLTGFMPSADMQATANCLRAIGTELSLDGDTLHVQGFAQKSGFLPTYECGESGSTLRFFVPIALALTGGGVFRMHGRLGQRPMDVYRELFVPRGVLWRMGEGADGIAELTVSGHLQPGQYTLPGNVSSQFISGLLFALPLLQGDSTLTVLPPVESIDYIHMTLRALKDSGIRVEQTAPYVWHIPGFQRYHAVSGQLHGDWSQAAVLFCTAALGQDVKVSNISTDTVQGDSAVLKHLTALGAEVEESTDFISVTKGQPKAAVLDVHNCPDIAPILALVCQLTPGESRLTGCGRLRIKECDRLAATVEVLNTLGGNCRIDGDDIVVNGVESLTGGELPRYNDHRMVMLASIAALFCKEPVLVHDAEALNKSWPQYLNVYRSLGGKAE